MDTLKTKKCIPCRARGPRAHNLFPRLPFRMDSFVHGNVFFSFRLSIDWCVQYKNNQTLDALIKYVALYNILYSDQLEIRLSVFTLTYQYVCFVQTFTSLSPIYQSFCSNHYDIYIFQRRVLTLDPP